MRTRRLLLVWLRLVFPLALLLTVVAPGSGALRQPRFLDEHLLVTWYGNPRSARMGILGQVFGEGRADGLRRQAEAYIPLTTRRVVAAYHLVAIVAQPSPGAGGYYRRRETLQAIEQLLLDARRYGFALVLDVQLGRAPVEAELKYLEPFLAQPDVHLALDPEFRMAEGNVPGQKIGSMSSSDVNAAVDFLGRIAAAADLPAKVLILHQFTLAMLPDKKNIRRHPDVELVLNMDGFGSRALKRASYRAVMRQHQLDYAGIKLFYQQDTNLFTPRQVMDFDPLPSVVIYQ